MVIKDYFEVVDEVKSQSRNYFYQLMENRENIIASFEKNKLKMKMVIADKWKELPDGKSFLVIIDNGFPFIFRRRGQDFYFLVDYDLAHLRNSVIANILLNEEVSLKIKLDRIIYLYYQYWFLKKKNTTIDEITHNVCFELQEIVKLIIEKELTLYRLYPTNTYLEGLRIRLTSERLVSLARAQIINFRK
jgi:hypothetical protein